MRNLFKKNAAKKTVVKSDAISSPEHVGIILDGNRRWAKQRNFSALVGHNQGLKQVEPVVREAFNQGVKFVSLFVFSTDNWKRTSKEVNHLMSLFLRYLKKESERLLKDGFRLKIAGQLNEKLNQKLKEAILDVQKKSAKNKGPTVVLCFNYGGQVEILDMVKKIVKQKLKLNQITLESLKSALYLPEIPPLDLIIRTSGEQRLSGFQLWRSAYAEIIFVDKFWPDFTPQDVRLALQTYAQRNRRFGGN